MLIYLNGTFVDEKEAVISPYDHGYLYGLGVFETFRVYDGHPFLFDDHYERLTTALSYLNIQWTMTREDVLTIVGELLKKNSIQHARIRLNVSAGIGEVGLQIKQYDAPSCIIFVNPLPVYTEIVEKEGIVLQQRRNTPEGDFRLKSHHYLNNILGKREIGSNPNREGIFLTKEGYIAEGIVSNLFFVINGVLCTPSVETGILNGITRLFILRLANKLGIPTKEGLFTQEELFESDEVFVTNSIQEIVPLCSVNSVTFVGKEGAITRTLLNAYSTYRYTLRSRYEI